jgi:RNA polymerase sigma factor (sigma-70 family)
LLLKEDHMHVVSDDHPEINVHVKELIEMIRQLPIGYQTIFNMHAVEGYSHVEIGQLLGISEGTSRSQYMRARNQLISWLQKQPGEFKKTSYA